MTRGRWSSSRILHATVDGPTGGRDNRLVAGSLSWITDESWPSDEGWPYPDADADLDRAEEPVDVDADGDVDLLSLHAASSHLFDDLDPLERQVVSARYGLDGLPPRSMRAIQHELGLPRPELRTALGGGLMKLRSRVG